MMPLNPKQMKKMMKQMGIDMDEIEAEEVIIRTKSEELIFKNPTVTKISAKGIENVDIAIVDMKVIPETPVVGVEAIVVVTLQNQGNVVTPATTLRLYIEDIGIDSLNVPSLSPNEIITKTFKWIPKHTTE